MTAQRVSNLRLGLEIERQRRVIYETSPRHDTCFRAFRQDVQKRRLR